MAKFDMELPLELIKEVENLEKNTATMLEKMTQAGAKVVEQNIRANVPASFKQSDIMNCLQITKSYKTTSDDGINTKVAFYGYFTNHKGVVTPAPLVANVVEYGSRNTTKYPYLRKSFNKNQITKAMLEAQKEFIKE